MNMNELDNLIQVEVKQRITYKPLDMLYMDLYDTSKKGCNWGPWAKLIQNILESSPVTPVAVRLQYGGEV